MSSKLVKAVDSSFDPLTPEEARCLKQSGVELFIQCLWTGAEQPAVRATNLRTAYESGLEIAGYISLNRFRRGVWHMEQGRAGIPSDLWEAMQLVAIDVELPGILADEVQAAAKWIEGEQQDTAIYTSYHAWTDLVIPSNSILLSRHGYLLWNAYWDGDPDVDFSRLQFGGWKPEQVIGEQWSGDTSVCGQHVDRNSFIRDLIFPEVVAVEPGGDDDMTEEEKRRKALASLLRAAAELIEAGFEVPNELRQMLAYAGVTLK